MAVSIGPITHPFTPPGGPVNAASTGNTPAVQGTSWATVPTSEPDELLDQLGAGPGVVGASGTGVGVQGTSTGSDAVQGTSSSSAHAGVSGINDSGGFGVWGRGSPAGHFESSKGNCVEAIGTVDNDAIVATTNSPHHAALAAHNNGGGYGLWASSTNNPGPEQSSVGGIGLYAAGATFAAVFSGAVQITGDGHFTGTLTVDKDINLPAGDCAEEFETVLPAEAEPGTVMVLTEGGAIEPSQNAYDKKVAGVISGAGDYRPAMILDRRESSNSRMPLALVGKVFCKVDAEYGPIEVGDLLTTSPTVGHAMKAADSLRAFGAVIGKALRSLPSGRGVVPVLVALQ